MDIPKSAVKGLTSRIKFYHNNGTSVYTYLPKCPCGNLMDNEYLAKSWYDEDDGITIANKYMCSKCNMILFVCNRCYDYDIGNILLVKDYTYDVKTQGFHTGLETHPFDPPVAFHKKPEATNTQWNYTINFQPCDICPKRYVHYLA